MIIKVRTWRALTSAEKIGFLKSLEKKNPLKAERKKMKKHPTIFIIPQLK